MSIRGPRRQARFTPHEDVKKFLKKSDVEQAICGVGFSILDYTIIPRKVDGSTQSQLAKIKLNDGRSLFVKQTAEKIQTKDQEEAAKKIKANLGSSVAKAPFILPIYFNNTLSPKNGLVVYPLIDGKNLYEVFQQKKDVVGLYQRIGATLSRLHLDGMAANGELEGFYGSGCDLTGKSILIHDDFNATNIMVSKEGKIFFVDTDGIAVKKSESYRNIIEFWVDIAGKDPVKMKALLEGYVVNFLPEKQNEVLAQIKAQIAKAKIESNPRADILSKKEINKIIAEIAFPIKLDLSPIIFGEDQVMASPKVSLSKVTSQQASVKTSKLEKEESVKKIESVGRDDVVKMINQLPRDKENIKTNGKLITYEQVAAILTQYLHKINTEEEFEDLGRMLINLEKNLAVGELSQLKDPALDRFLKNYRKKKMALAAGSLVQKTPRAQEAIRKIAERETEKNTSRDFQKAAEVESIVKNNFEQLLLQRVIELPSFVRRDDFVDYLLGRKSLEDFVLSKEAKKPQRREAVGRKGDVFHQQLLSELQEKIEKMSPESTKEPSVEEKSAAKQGKIQRVANQSQPTDPLQKLFSQPLTPKSVREEGSLEISPALIEKRLLAAVSSNLIAINKPLPGKDGVISYLFGETKIVASRTISEDRKFKRMVSAERQAGQAVQNKQELLKHFSTRFPRIKTELGLEEKTSLPVLERSTQLEPPETVKAEYERLYALCARNWKPADGVMTEEVLHLKTLEALRSALPRLGVSLSTTIVEWLNTHHQSGKLNKPSR